MRAVAAVIALGLAIAACDAMPAPTPAPVVHLQNQTDIPIAIHVNGAWVGTYPPGAVTAVTVPVQEGEYRIEARSPSGAALVTLLGTAAMVDAAQAQEQVFDVWEDLPCGRIALSVGAPPDRPPPEAPTGPCR